MSTGADVWQVQYPVEGPGGRHNRLQTRQFVIATKDFTQVEQGVPVPVLFGRTVMAGITITPIWNFRARAITQKMGK